jgi:hypothetical protein
MIETTLNQPSPTFPNLPPPYPGYISWLKRPHGLYASHVKSTYKKDGKFYHESDYLGKVIDKIDNLFYHTDKGFYHFTLENGYIPRPDLSIVPSRQQNVTLRYGDFWIVDEIIKRYALFSVLNKVTPDETDTLLTLIAYKLSTNGGPYDLVSNWYERSYGKIHYPNPIISSGGISKYLQRLGQDYSYRAFYINYLNYLRSYNNFSESSKFPILIDSTGLQNDINIPLTAINNHNGVINNEIRLIYVVDQKSGLPIFFDLIPGNIIDNSTLKFIIRTLSAYEVEISFIIMDAGYSSESNLIFLNELNVPYIARMNANLKAYKDIINNCGNDIEDPQYLVKINDKFMHCKKIPYEINNNNYFTYLIKDINRISNETANCYKKYYDEPNAIDLIREKIKHVSKFVLISNKDFASDEIGNLYRTRHGIEQLFDISKNNGSLLPLRVHGISAMKGHVMLSFIASIISLFINNELKPSKYCSSNAFAILKELDIDIYPNKNIIKIPTKAEKEVISCLNLQTPFEIELGNLNNDFLKSLRTKRKVGRPKGRKNKPIEVREVPVINSHDFEITKKEHKKRGRPPKVRSEGPLGQYHTQLDASTVRKRGRPKGSKNIPKEKLIVLPDSSNQLDRDNNPKKRGRPPKSQSD